MKCKIVKHIAAAAVALAVMTGTVPFKPFTDFIGSNTVSAVTDESQITFELLSDGTYKVKRVPNTLSVIEIPAEHDGKPVTVIDSNFISTLRINTVIKKIIIPDTVTHIGEHAFQMLGELSEIKLSDNLESIDFALFDKCYNLKSITIPKSVSSIGYNAFDDCRSLERIDVDPDNPYLASFDGVAYNKQFTEIVAYPCAKSDLIIPSNVTSIPANGIYNFYSRNTINNNQEYGKNDALKHITILNGNASIGKQAFMNCVSLESVSLPSSLTTVEMGAFFGCDSLKVVYIPSSVTDIGFEAFGYTEYMNEHLIDGFVIRGAANSAADAYAKSKGITFEALDEHAITASAVTNGTINVSGTAFTGENVTIDVKPNIGYAASNVTYNDGTEHTITPQDGVYSFVMPDADVTVSASFESIAEDENKISGTSLSLDGAIGVNVYVKPTADIAANGYAVVKGPNDFVAKKYYFKDLTAYHDGYRFSSYVYSSQMSEQVSFEIYDNNGLKQSIVMANGEAIKDNTYTPSVKSYIDYVLQGEDGTLKELAKAMNDYGAYAQKYFEKQQSMTPGQVDISDITSSDLFNEQMLVKIFDDGYFKYHGMSLLLKEKTSVRLYFYFDSKSTSGVYVPSVTVTGGGRSEILYANRCKGNYYYVEFDNIAANELNTRYTFSFSNGNEYQLSALSYVYEVLFKYQDDAGKKDLIDLSKALYLYSMAAAAYFNNIDVTA